jgi:hypothetical protein
MSYDELCFVLLSWVLLSIISFDEFGLVRLSLVELIRFIYQVKKLDLIYKKIFLRKVETHKWQLR